ncbi:epoxyqueuosine reductase, partial [Bacillus atrophaeus]|nr:epoxyqueuosine reductase [Bacillus atrophaeus]
VYQLKEELIEYAKSIGVDKIGFTTADTFDSLKDRLILQESLGYLSGFEEPDIEKRVTPTLLLPKAKSIVAIALAYPSRMK